MPKHKEPLDDQSKLQASRTGNKCTLAVRPPLSGRGQSAAVFAAFCSLFAACCLLLAACCLLLAACCLLLSARCLLH